MKLHEEQEEINGIDPSGYKTKKGRMLTGEQLKCFMTFWKIFDYQKGKAEAADAWYDLKVGRNMYSKILFAAEKEAKDRRSLIEAGKTPKMAQGWLSSRRFEDEANETNTEKKETESSWPRKDIINEFESLEREKRENPDLFITKEDIRYLIEMISIDKKEENYEIDQEVIEKLNNQKRILLDGNDEL